MWALVIHAMLLRAMAVPARLIPAIVMRARQRIGVLVSGAALRRRLGLTVLAGVLTGTAGCVVGPDYRRPPVETPAAFKEAPPGWKTARPAPPQTDGRWWTAYGDRLLDQLADSVKVSNQNVLAAEAAYRQAQAALAAARAGYYPTLNFSGNRTRGRNSAVQATNSATSPSQPISETQRVTLSASWEPDLWGSVRRAVESSGASAQASAADLQFALLSAQVTLVQSYLQLRVMDAQRKLLEDTVAAYRRSYQITRNRYDAGVAARTDVTQAETQLLNAQAQVIDNGVQRGQLEHAIAALTGRPPSALTIAPTDRLPTLPPIPIEVPSELLERRPDVGGAERRMAAANAQIGVAQAAFFPTLTINAQGGISTSDWHSLLALPYRFWSLGPSLALPLLDGGARSAAKEQAIASYDHSVATYRQTVLSAFQEIEDNLLALRLTEEEQKVQQQVVRSAAETLALTNNQYLAGTVSYLNVVTAQTADFSARVTALNLTSRQLVASTVLLKATGGSW